MDEAGQFFEAWAKEDPDGLALELSMHSPLFMAVFAAFVLGLIILMISVF